MTHEVGNEVEPGLRKQLARASGEQGGQEGEQGKREVLKPRLMEELQRISRS